MRSLTCLAWCSLAMGCASGNKGTAGGAVPAPEWKLEGTRIIGCCCLAPCPCRINKPPTHCHGCDGVVVVHIERGYVGPVKMDGLDYAMVGRSFGEQSAGNWGYVYVSDKATKEQVVTLQGMLEEELKGMGSKSQYLVGKFAGLRQVPVVYKASPDHREISGTIPGILEFKTRSIVLPGHTEPVMSTGIFDDYGDRFIHAEAVANTYKDPTIGRSFDLTGRQANQADFAIDSIRAQKGGLGWGCWSAHPELGSKEKYQEKSIDHP